MVLSAPVSMEDFRPELLSEICGQEGSIARLKALAEGVRQGRIVPPNLLLYGPPGVGKTTAARAFAREVLGTEWEYSFHRMDAADDRSLDFVQRRLAPLVGRPSARGAPFRIVFLDDADTLTADAQSALRSVLEAASGTTQFILACNDPVLVSEPIRSRCLALPFDRVTRDDVLEVLRSAAARASFRSNEEVLARLAEMAAGIPRQAVKLLVEEMARQ